MHLDPAFIYRHKAFNHGHSGRRRDEAFAELYKLFSKSTKSPQKPSAPTSSHLKVAIQYSR
jgi:hypothetical protein